MAEWKGELEGSERSSLMIVTRRGGGIGSVDVVRPLVGDLRIFWVVLLQYYRYRLSSEGSLEQWEIAVRPAVWGRVVGGIRGCSQSRENILFLKVNKIPGAANGSWSGGRKRSPDVSLWRNSSTSFLSVVVMKVVDVEESGSFDVQLEHFMLVEHEVLEMIWWVKASEVDVIWDVSLSRSLKLLDYGM